MSTFDKIAKDFDKNASRVERAAAMSQAIIDNVPLTQSMIALDYGTGTGSILLSLQPHVKHVTGLDYAKGMLEVLEEKIQLKGCQESVTIAQHNIETDSIQERAYDLIVSGMALHHIEDPAVLIKKTLAALKPGGYLCIADLEKEDGTFHDNPMRAFIILVLTPNG